MQDVMLDLETFGLKPGHIIRSVGAVEFNLETGKLGNEFYANIDEKSCKKYKLTKDQGTVDWWNKPDMVEAQKQLLIDVQPVDVVCQKFADFFKKTGAVYLWSQGSNFDGVLFNEVLERVGVKPPWRFFNAMDTRTAYRMSGFNPFSIKRAGTYHNALDDAKHQVVCVHRSHLKIQGRLV